MLACGRCKKPFMKLEHSVWKSGKEIEIRSIMVCEKCWNRANKLQVRRIIK